MPRIRLEASCRDLPYALVHRWTLKLLPVLEKAFYRRKQAVGKSWRMDEARIAEVQISLRDQGRFILPAIVYRQA